MKVLFLGSSHFSKIVLEKMIENKINVVGVVTQPDRPAGRGHKLSPTEVKVFAEERGIKVYTFEKIRLSMEEVKKIDYDISVVASFGQILPQEFLDFKMCINVHPSLLPLYRGASPIQSAILNGDKITGVTIMKVAMEVDAGDIILQERVEIEDEETYLNLEERLGKIGGELSCEAINQFGNGTIKFEMQEHDKATFTQKFTKEDCKLDFSQSAESVVNRVRALGEEYGCQMAINGQVFKVKKAREVEKEADLQPYEIANNKKRFLIGAKKGAVEILLLTPPSGKTVAGRDYLNGHSEILGQKVDKCLEI